MSKNTYKLMSLNKNGNKEVLAVGDNKPLIYRYCHQLREEGYNQKLIIEKSKNETSWLVYLLNLGYKLELYNDKLYPKFKIKVLRNNRKNKIKNLKISIEELNALLKEKENVKEINLVKDMLINKLSNILNKDLDIK